MGSPHMYVPAVGVLYIMWGILLVLEPIRKFFMLPYTRGACMYIVGMLVYGVCVLDMGANFH